MPEPTDQELLHDAVRSTEQEIMDAAFAADPPADEPVDEQPAGEEDQPQEQAEASDDRPRDEQGRFAKAKPDADKPQQEQPEQGQQEQQQAGEDADVPRWRLREIAEERRQAQAERDQLRVELTRLQTQMSQMQRQPAPQQPQQEQQIDPLLDPAGWQRKIESTFEEKLRTMALNMDLKAAHREHKEVFEKAYTALLQEGQRGNGALVRQLVGNPEGAGDRIVQWFRTNEMIRETKGDLQGYEKTLREKLLKDPEFIKAAMEAARGQANGGQQQQVQQGQRPNNITRLPPSLNRVAGGSQHVDPIDADDSDKAVFDYAFRE